MSIAGPRKVVMPTTCARFCGAIRGRLLQDVVYGAANMKAMSFIGGGAQDFQAFFDFLGTVKDKRVPPAGSPFQMTFPGEAATPQGMTPANESVPACWESALKCSCGDCPDGPQCAPVRSQLCLDIPPLIPIIKVLCCAAEYASISTLEHVDRLRR